MNMQLKSQHKRETHPWNLFVDSWKMKNMPTKNKKLSENEIAEMIVATLTVSVS